MDCKKEPFGRFNALSADTLPICSPGPDITIPFGTSTINFRAAGSSCPEPFKIFWDSYSTPYDPSPPQFKFDDPGSFNFTIEASSLIRGTYKFLLYVSDFHTQVPCFWTVVIE